LACGAPEWEITGLLVTFGPRPLTISIQSYPGDREQGDKRAGSQETEANLLAQIFWPPFACNLALPAHNGFRSSKKEDRSLAPERIMAPEKITTPEKIMTREKMNHVTNALVAPPHHSSQEFKDSCFFSKTAQKQCGGESLQ
jgi:hypothetical protein